MILVRQQVGPQKTLLLEFIALRFLSFALLVLPFQIGYSSVPGHDFDQVLCAFIP